MKESVTNSGDFDAVTRYYYHGQKIVETRVGDNPTTYHQQFIHGTRYIDELVMIRVKDKGDLYVHQDANWNVIGLTDLGGHLVERYVLTPYGEVTVYQETGYGDRDGDGDVDATDKGTPGSTCTGTVSSECRILDLDFDGDYDSTDAGLFDSLPQGLARHPGRIATAVHQPFGHQGLLHEPEVSQYQNRYRQYDPAKRRFVQRDPLGVISMETSGDGFPAIVHLERGDTEQLVQGQMVFARAMNAAKDEFFRIGLSHNHFNEMWLIAVTGPNQYTYVQSHPIMDVDPSGLACMTCGKSENGSCCGGCKFCGGVNPTWISCLKCSHEQDPPNFEECDCGCWYIGGLNCACCKVGVPAGDPDECPPPYP